MSVSNAAMLKALLGIEKNLGRIADALERKVPKNDGFIWPHEEPLPEGGNGGFSFPWMRGRGDNR